MKKVLSLLLVMVMVLGLTACTGSNSNTNQGSTAHDISNNTGNVALVYGDTTYTNKDIAGLYDAELEAIRQFVWEKGIMDFFQDKGTVTDEEVEFQLNEIKNQVGEEQWSYYLMYQGYSDEETLKADLKEMIRQDKYIQKVAEGLTVSDEEMQAVYSEDEDSYNIAVLDIVYAENADDYNAILSELAAGKEFEQVAEEYELEIEPDRHTYFTPQDGSWVYDFHDLTVGSINYSPAEEASYLIGKVKELNIGLDNEKVKENLVSTYKNEQAYSQVETELYEYLKKIDISVYGEKMNAYELLYGTEEE